MEIQEQRIMAVDSKGVETKEIGRLSVKEDMLTTADGTVGTTLIPATIYNTLQSAVRRKLVFRPLAAIIVGPSGIPGSSLNINLQDAETGIVYEVAEGADIPLGKETYTNRGCTPKKYGVRIGITKEMIEDSQFDLMRFNAETAAYEIAKNEDELIVAQLDAAATASGNTVANANATLPVTDITAAMQQLEAANYVATDMIVGVEVANDLRNLDTFTEADKAGINDPSKRLIGTIFGMNVLVSVSVSAKLAYVVDRNKAFAIVEKRPITLVNWDDYARDTKYLAATQRVASVYLYSGATSEITTT